MILGIVSTLVALFLLHILRLFSSRFSNRSFNEVVPYLRPDNLESLSELLDATLERYLCLNLELKQFRKEQLKRVRLAHECISRRTRNVVIWQEWADTELKRSRKTGNSEVSTA